MISVAKCSRSEIASSLEEESSSLGDCGVHLLLIGHFLSADVDSNRRYFFHQLFSWYFWKFVYSFLQFNNRTTGYFPLGTNLRCNLYNLFLLLDYACVDYRTYRDTWLHRNPPVSFIFLILLHNVVSELKRAFFRLWHSDGLKGYVACLWQNDLSQREHHIVSSLTCSRIIYKYFESQSWP